MGPEALPARVARTAERYGMDIVRPLAMVSGGPDSVALLRALLELGSEPVALHVDHGLRGEESRRDAEFARDLCDRLNVPYELRHAEMEAGNVQEEARRERYRISEEVADSYGLSTVVTGHTADDVAETVLMNLARGAGLRGLAGIPPIRGRYARPLIEVNRSHILAYLESLGQPYRTDPTNLTGKYARNRVRLEVLPVLEELYPGAGGNIARAAALARDDLEALEALAENVIYRRGREVVIKVEEIRGIPPALRRHVVRRAYALLLPDAPPLDSRLVASVLRLAEGNEGTRMLDLPGGVVVACRFGEEIAVYRRREAGEARALGIGETVFDGWRVRVHEITELDRTDAARPEVAYLDATRGPYRVRAAREGDTIRPLGLGGTKKVLRAMMDRKVPRDLRRRMPVVVDGRDRVAWIPFGELDEGFAVTPATEKVLRLEVEEAL